MRVDLVQEFTGDPCIGELCKRSEISTGCVRVRDTSTHPKVVMSWGAISTERTEPQVSLILRCIRTLHALEEDSIQEHRVDRVFPHYYRDWRKDDPSAQDAGSVGQTRW